MAEREMPTGDHGNKADQKATEAADFDQWDRQMSGQAEHDDQQAEAAEDRAAAASMEHQLRVASATEAQQASEAAAREKIGNMADMDQQQQALEAHEQELPPQEVVAEQMIANLHQAIAEGVTTDRVLSTLDDPRNPLYRDAIPVVFQKLGFENPMPELEAEEKNWLGRVKHENKVVEHTFGEGEKTVRIAAHRNWDRANKQPYYIVTGGLAEQV